MDVFIGNMFLLIEMACKTKRTLARTELKKVWEENAKKGEKSRRSKKKRGGREKGSEKEQEGHESPKGNKKKFQSSTELLIRKLSFQRLVKELIQARQNDLKVHGLAVKALQEAGEIFIVGLLEQVSLCTIHTKCVTIMLKNHPTSQEN